MVKVFTVNHSFRGDLSACKSPRNISPRKAKYGKIEMWYWGIGKGNE